MPEKRLLVVIGAKITDLEAKMRQVSKIFKDAEKSFKGFRDMGKRITSLGRDITFGVTLPLVSMGAVALKTSIDLEDAFAGVRKTVAGTSEQLNQLKKDLDELAKRIPIPIEQIYAVAEAAGQLGIEQENIVSFTEVMSKMGAATNLASDEAALALARFANIVQMPQNEFDRLGSTVAALGNDLAATESEIVDMAVRLAGAGKALNMSEGDVLGFAGALSSVGILAEMGGSAFSRMFLNLQNSVMMGKDSLQVFSSVAGMSIQDFTNLFNKDASEAIIRFIEGLNRVQTSGGNVAMVLESVGLNEIRVRDALLRASNAGDLFRQSIDLGNISFEENIALNNMAAKRFDTTAKNIQLFTNKIRLMTGTFGDIMAPALLSLIKPLESIADKMSKWSEGTKRTVIILGMITTAIGPFLFGLGSLMRMFPVLVLGVKGLGTAFLWLKANPIGLLITAIPLLIAGGNWLIENWDLVRYYGLKAWSELKQGVYYAVKAMLSYYNYFLGWIPGLGDKIQNASAQMDKLIAKEKNLKLNKPVKKSSGSTAYEKSISKYKISGDEDPFDPNVIGLGGSNSAADKSAKAAEKVGEAWIGTSDEVKNALQIMQSGHEAETIRAEMLGDKIASLKLKESQLTEELAKQKIVVAVVEKEIKKNVATGKLAEETQDEYAKRTAELNAKLADEKTTQADLEKQLWETKEAVKDQADAMKDLSREVLDVSKKYDEDMVEALEDYRDKVAEVNADVKDQISKATEDFENQLDQRTDALANFVDLFDAVSTEQFSGKQLLDNLRSQVKTFEEWSDNIQKLVSRGVDQGLIEQLRQMGPKAAPQIAALLTLTDDQLIEYVELWRQKNEDARNEANIQLEQQRTDLEEKLIEINNTAREKLAQYEAEWKDTQEKIRQNVITEMQTIQSKYEELVGKGKAFGLNFMDEFGVGMVEGFLKVQEIINQQMLEMETLFPAHSPAEKGPLANLRRWGQNFVRTFQDGIKLEMPNTSNLVSGMMSNLGSSLTGISAAGAVSSGDTYITLNFNGADPEANWKYFKRQLALSGIKTPSR